MQTINNIMDFAEEIKSAIEARTDYEVRVNEIRKNNDVTRIGICITTKDNNIAPTIYLEQAFEVYQTGKSFDSVVDDVLHLSEDNQVAPFETDLIMNWDTAKDNIFMRLVNRGRNSERLTEIPFAKFGDLAIIFCIHVKVNIECDGAITITNNIMNSWGKNLNDIFAVAQTSKSVGKTMWEMLTDLAGADLEDCLHVIKDEPMFVLTNSDKMHGAIAMIDTPTLKRISEEVEDDLYIIPSSIHELIVTKRSYMNEEKCNDLIKEVNATQVGPDEILSDHCYPFIDGKLYMNETMEEEMVVELN